MFDTVVGCRFTMTANGKHYVTPDRVNIVRVELNPPTRVTCNKSNRFFLYSKVIHLKIFSI